MRFAKQYLAGPVWAGLCLIIISGCGRAPAPLPAAARPATQPAVAATQPAAPTDYVQVIRLDHPEFPSTQPLAATLALTDSAHILMPEPIYVDALGHVWITRSEVGPIPPAFWKNAINDQIHLVARTVLYAAWQHNKAGTLVPTLVCPSADGGEEIIDAEGSHPLPRRRYAWGFAVTTNDRVFVPADDGVCAFTFKPEPVEQYHDLSDAGLAAATTTPIGSAPTTSTPARYVFDSRGIIWWIPCDDLATGGGHAARYLDGQWTNLTGDDWAARIVHLVVFLDGSILQIVRNADDGVGFHLAPLDQAIIDAKHISDLIDKLDSAEQADRDSATEELLRFGPGAWPVLEKALPDQPPEAQSRIRLILRNRQSPTLAGFSPIDGKLRVACRSRENGVVLFSPAMNTTAEDGTTSVVAPVWIRLIPGLPIIALPGNQTDDLDPASSTLSLIHEDLIDDEPVKGARWFDGGRFVPLTRKSEHGFENVIDRDARGRWFLTMSPKPEWTGSGIPGPIAAIGPTTVSSVATTTAPSAVASGPTIDPSHATLIIDPTLPDQTPRLPIWLIDSGDEAGWDAENWPAIKKNAPWRLHDTEWQSMDEKTDAFFTELPPTTAPTTALAATMASAPTTGPGIAGTPILTTPDGTRYYDGHTTLTVIDKLGRSIVWNLPDRATGDGDVRLLQSPEGKLFLFNVPGRIVRFSPTPGAAEPFHLDAVFTHNIPFVDHPSRIWIDPGGHLDIADGSRLWVMFPSGVVPREILEKMPDDPTNDDE